MNIVADTLFAVKKFFRQRRTVVPQKYDVQYHIEIPERSREVLIAMPGNHSYQRLESDITIEGPSNRSTHQLSGNRVDRFTVEPETSAQEHIVISYSITVEPRTPNIPADLRLSDYSALVDSPYLHSQKSIDCDNSGIEELVATHVNSEQPIKAITEDLYNIVTNRLTYGKPIQGLYSSNDALHNHEVDCGGFSTLLIALYRKLGIPARLVAGFWAGYENNDMHAWIEFMLPDGTWVPIDPSTGQLSAQQRTYKSGGFGVVGSDRITVSTGSDFTLDFLDPPHTTALLQTPIVISADGELTYPTSYKLTANRA